MKSEETYTGRVVLLEHTFRVWCKGKVGEYVVSLSHLGLTLQTRSLRTSCCHLCSDWKCIQVFGRDILACRPALGVQGTERPNLGPPLFQLITYPLVGKAPSKVVFYFHLRPKETKTAEGTDDEDEDAQSVLYHFDHKQVHLLKQNWVKTILELFFPGGSPLTSSGPFSKSRLVNVTQSKTYLSQKILVALNPLAGKGNALKVFRDILVPIFKDAATEYEVLVTEYPGHAYSVVKNENLARWKGVVCVSGDGLIHEVLNGLFDRVDWQDALSHLSVSSIPIGTISAFGRAMIHLQKEPFHHDGILSNALNVGRAITHPMDLIFVQTKDRSQVGVCNFGWGLLNELKGTKTNKLKLLKNYRLGLTNLFRVSSITVQSAVISYLPVQGGNSSTKQLSENLSSKASSQIHSLQSTLSNRTTCSSCSIGLLKDAPNLSKTFNSSRNTSESTDIRDSSMDPLITSTKAKKATSKTKPRSPAIASPPPASRYTYTSLLAEGQLYFRSWQELDVRLQHHGPFPLLNNHTVMMASSVVTASPPSSMSQGTLRNQKRPKPYFPAMPEMPKPLHQDLGWVTEVGDFVAVHVFNMPCLDQDRTVVPDGSINDGRLRLLLIRGGIKRADLYKFLNAIESDATFMSESMPPLPDGVEIISIKGIRITPITMETAFQVDDQIVTGSVECIQAFVMPGVARTMVK
ncbi:hypothetical protein TCAL_00196 [Tigriopus californicus]|uniref:DAGKc domain-containing protein n=1 Tax=Tigriopus californicus TaxID=6832 RepID=A0A553P4F5_TIGCA|nr:sphingosine kinase 2-like [Tigriopus californicus]TRY72571.1 hypothetical protein TCAL_00196 [Tigriopus californicus]|eukprot:TCALIF_00196-PA protein Name:"Similar to Sphk1 Sphingosine kinase 1 (Rattus norvegicus)" AED:0.01 eAED:0.05 QI:0/-1/0/1/-1/1/1/0/689